MSDIATIDQTAAARNEVRPYSSIKGDDFDTRKRVFNALSNAKPLQDNLGKRIDVEHIVQVPVDVTDEITGEVSTLARTVFITPKGEAFAATSRGIDNSIAQIFSTLGEPHVWPEAIGFVASREGEGTRKYITLRLA